MAGATSTLAVANSLTGRLSVYIHTHTPLVTSEDGTVCSRRPLPLTVNRISVFDVYVCVSRFEHVLLA